MQENLSLYHIFFITARTGSISQAARELYISQPAVSKAIRKLEENLDTQLFRRSSRGVTLTPDGETLCGRVKEAFALLSEGESAILHNRSRCIPRLHIGASSTLTKYVLLEHLQPFIAANPQVRISLSCQSTYQTLRLLHEEKISLGLIGRPKKLSGFHFRPLQRITDTFVATNQYLENQRQLFPSESLFDTAAFMMLDEENITRQSVSAILKEHRLELSHILEVTSMDLLIDFAKIGLGIACVIRELVQDELDSGALVEVPIGFSFPPREIGFVCRSADAKLPLLSHFFQE